MSQCLRINFTMDVSKNFLQTFIQKNARSLQLEGTVQMERNNVIKLIICGKKDNLDQFVDLFHKRVAKEEFDNMEIEPFIRDKDFRGVFRIIE